MERIFDDAATDVHGKQTGGAGKQVMYTARDFMNVFLRELNFEKSPPFTNLIRDLFRLFQSIVIVNLDEAIGRESRDQDIANIKKLESCEHVIQLMRNAVERNDWPKEHDRVLDSNYPRDEGIDEADPIGRASMKVLTSAGRAPKREREEDDGDTTSTRRSKTKAV